MACSELKLQSCEVEGSTFQGRKINFTNRDISEDTFTAKVKSYYGQVIETISGIKNGSEVYFPYTQIENLKRGTYVIEIWADFKDLANERIATEKLEVK